MSPVKVKDPGGKQEVEDLGSTDPLAFSRVKSQNINSVYLLSPPAGRSVVVSHGKSTASPANRNQKNFDKKSFVLSREFK